MSIEDRNSEVNETLCELYDCLNETIELAEKTLIEMKVPGNVKIGYDGDACVGIVKIGGQWRLCHARQTDFPEPDWKPLRDCPALVRLAAIGSLDKLRAAIVDAKESLLPEIDTAIRSLTETLGGWQQEKTDSEKNSARSPCENL